jgi:hypothetical protein
MQKRSRVLVAAAAASLTATATMFVALSASALTTVYTQRVVSKTIAATPLTHALASAQCADDEVNTGGGFTMTGTTDPSAYTVFADVPSGNGWVAGIWLAEGYGPVDLTAYAVCVKKLSGAVPTRQVVHATGVVGAQGSAAVQPTCPSGQVATGGGYRQTSLSTVSHSVFANRPSGGSAWNVGYYGQPGDEFRGSVVCIKIPQDAPLEVRTTTESFAVPGQSTGTGIVRCNSAEAISGGGWFVRTI